jgi:NRPS condensation-like uncharacterized protein
MDNKNLSRPLGSAERLFIVLGHLASKSFALVAEIEGSLSVEKLQTAAIEIQRRHPQLRAGIQMDNNLNYWFEYQNTNTIKVEAYPNSDPGNWISMMEDELTAPFILANSPLFRVIMLGGGVRSTLIFITHHSIGDGLSLVNIFQDLLDYLSGIELPKLLPPKSMDELLALDESLLWKSSPPTNFITTQNQLQNLRGQTISIDRIKLDKESTNKIMIAAKSNEVTVNGLLYAALCLAFTTIYGGEGHTTLSLRTPASVRKTLNIENDFGLYITTMLTTVIPGEFPDIWSLARNINGTLRDISSINSTVEYIKRFRALLLRPVDVEQAAGVFKSAPGINLMLSNLGIVQLNTRTSGIKIKALWGPMVISGDGSEQTVGAATVNGQLHLTNTSMQFLPNLLNTACSIILNSID